MSKQFSEFTLNFNSGARSNDKAPTMRGKAKVVADGAVSEFDIAAWGPNKAQTGGPDFYNVTLTPKDRADAARQLKTDVPDGSVPNTIEGFEIKKLGSGRIFERSTEELSAGKPPARTCPSSMAMPLCCCARVRATSTSRRGTARSTTSTRAMRRCTTLRLLPRHVPQALAGPGGPLALLLKMAN